MARSANHMQEMCSYLAQDVEQSTKQGLDLQPFE